MAWIPPDEKSARLLHQIITREREKALTTFDQNRKRIEREQAARGVLGGPVLIRCGEAAESLVRQFANQTVPELVDVVQAVAEGKLPEALEWIRTTMTEEIDSLVNGLGGRIDALKTGARVQGAVGRLQRVRLEAVRDVEIALAKAELRVPPPSRRTAHVDPVKTIGMYNLLIAGHEHAWDGRPFTLEERSRVLTEYTDPDLTRRFADLGEEAVAELLELPSVFAYERGLKTDPLFGRLSRVSRRERDVRIDYEIIPVQPFMTWRQFEEMGRALGITNDFEFGRQHWSVKEVDLDANLALKGISLPRRTERELVDITQHEFAVALSFPGERRDLVRRLAEELERTLGENSVFYDDFYPGQLAQLSLDTLLQGIYGKRSKVVVVVAGADYQRKEWCGLEFRAIKDRIMAREYRKVMVVRTDEGEVDGIFKTDGFVDARRFSVEEIARMVKERVDLLTVPEE